MRLLTGGLLTIALFWVAVGPAADAPATGTISGVVRFTGVVPKPEIITTSDGGRLEHYDLVVDGKTQGLRSVFVQLEDAPAQAKVEKAEPVLMDQRDMIFLPRVVAVRHGQAVRFDNNDLCNHSVQAVSTVAANQFNRFVLPAQPIDHVFELQKKPVVIGCSLHSWMRAWVYVVPHPWFAITDRDGKFTIPKVPTGKYTLTAHHPDTGLQDRQTVQVESGKTAEVTVEWKKTGR
ncbi:MAG: carboxypeptidase regulatory-like domain-containing protein [Planctomycetia bacterium]|nr:carboxypeptidase regulatory-like domain-containing protein [Planctomycetia bacterium]